MAEIINSLYFDDVAVEDELRAIIQDRLTDSDIYDMFNKDVTLIPLDDTVTKETKLPAITFEVIDGLPRTENQEDIQIQKYTSFSVELNVYTSGENRKRNNRELCNKLILLLQQNQSLGDYYNRGLILRENSELSYDVDQVTRRVIRMTAVCDNTTKTLYSII